MAFRNLGFAALSIVALNACGGAVASDPGDGGTIPEASTVDAPKPPNEAGAPTGTPPSKPPAPPTGSSTTKTFAVKAIYLGETSRTGQASDTAWKQFGYNLDGKVTSGASTDVCTRAKGAPSSNQADGAQGIDNAFGAIILPLIKSASASTEPSKTVSALYQNGLRTIQLGVVGLDGSPSQTATGLAGGIFPSLAYSGDGPSVPFPGFGPTTDWPVRVEGLADGMTIAGGAKASLAGSWISSGVFVSGGSSLDLTFELPLGGTSVPMILHHAIVTLDPQGNGTFAGILDTEEFITAMRKAAGTLSTTLCGSQFDGIAQQLRQSSDILKDGTNVGGQDCNGTSVGIGFLAVPIANPTKIAKNPIAVPPDPCK